MTSNAALAQRFFFTGELAMGAAVNDCMFALPSLEEFANRLLSCRKEKDRGCALSLHASLCECGVEAHAFLGNYLVPLLVEVGSIGDARHAFDRTLCTNEYAWNSLITGYLKTGELEHAYTLYLKMQEDDSLHLNSTTFVTLLKACAKSKDLLKGAQIHAQVVTMNLESNLFVGSALVGMYTKCGLLLKAHESFDKLSDRDTVLWTSLLTGYVEHGRSEEALQFSEHMQQEGVFPDAVTFVCNLKACGSVGAVDKGQEIHVKAVCTSLLENDSFLGSALVDMYSKIGLLAQAHEVFHKLPVRDVVSWTALITGYVEHGQSEEALQCFEQMQLEGVLVDAITYGCSLKACGIIGATHKGVEIHAKVAEAGLLESDIILANTLVDMHGKCGSLSKSKQVFDILSKRDVVSWTALIGAYVEHSHNEDALACLESMQLEGVLPNSVTYVHSLKACSNIRAADKGQVIHCEAEIRGFVDCDIGTALVDVYVKCGLLASAQLVFDMLLVRDVVSWTALILGYAEHECGEQAMKCFKEMLHEGFTPSAVTFLCILKACATLGHLVEMHAEIERRSFLDKDVLMGTTLVGMYGKCGLLGKAREVFNRIQVRDVVSWNALIAAHVDDDNGVEALDCYDCMHGEGLSPDAITIVCTLKACEKIRAVNKARDIHIEAERKGFLERDFGIGTTLIGMYAKFGIFSKAWDVLQSRTAQSVAEWNSLLAGYVEHGYCEEAIMCLEEMKFQGVLPNFDTFLCILKDSDSVGSRDNDRKPAKDAEWRDFIEQVLRAHSNINHGRLTIARHVFDMLPVQDVFGWNALMAGYLLHGCCEEVLECHEEMQFKGVVPNDITLVCTLKACSNVGAFEKGQEIHADVERTGATNINTALGNTLVHMYAKHGFLAIAHEIFDNLPVRDVVSWTVLINGYAENQQGAGALRFLDRMELEGIVADTVTYASCLKACNSIGNVIRGEELHAELDRKGLLERDFAVSVALVSMYSQHGKPGKALEVLENLPVRGTCLWTAYMAACVERGLIDEALDCFECIQLDGFSPDIVTFVYGLKACAEKEDLEKGKDMHSTIEAMGLLESDLVLGTTLIDMYGKCGSLDAAQQVFDRLCVHDVVSWTTLMEGYAEQGRSKEALNCFEQMQVEGFLPGSAAFISALKNCVSKGERSYGQEFHAEIERRGLLEANFVAKALVDMYAKCGCFDIAKDLLYKLPFRDHVLWSSLIGGLAEHGHGEEALVCLDHMLSEGDSLDASLCIGGLKACGSIGSIGKGQELHAEIERIGSLKDDMLVGTTLVDMYVKCGALVKAQEVFDKLPDPDVVSWTALVVGYTHYGYGKEALRCFELMQLEGLSPDPVALICILKACSSMGAIHKGREIHLDIERKGFSGRDLAVGNTLIHMYAKNGLLPLAIQVFDKLEVRDTVSWNSLAVGYSQLGQSSTVFESLEKMIKAGVEPDSVTFKIVFSVCCRVGLYQSTQDYFEAMENDYGLAPSLEHVIGIVDAVCRAGHVDRAFKMMQKMSSSSNPVLWNRLLEACRDCGLVELGEQTFRHLVSRELTGAGKLMPSWLFTSGQYESEAKNSGSYLETYHKVKMLVS